MSWESDAYVVGIQLGKSQAGRNEKLVLLYLSNRYNQDAGMAWMKLRRMADDCGISRRGLSYVLRRLEKRGIVERLVGRGRGKVSLYRFPLMLTDSERKNPACPFNAQVKERGKKGAVFAPFIWNKRCKAEHSKEEPSLTKELAVSYFGSFAEKARKPIQLPVENRGGKMTRDAVGSPQRTKKAPLAPTTSAGLPHGELSKLAQELSEVRLVRHSGLKPLDAARCLAEAARSEVPGATGGGILAAVIEASKLPEGYELRSPMKWLMRYVKDRFRAMALYPDG